MKVHKKRRRATPRMVVRGTLHDLVVEDHASFITLAVVDRTASCLSCVFISHTEAVDLSQWFAGRASIAQRLAASEATRKAMLKEERTDG